jgi:hypothetical protein
MSKDFFNELSSPDPVALVVGSGAGVFRMTLLLKNWIWVAMASIMSP